MAESTRFEPLAEAIVGGYSRVQHVVDHETGEHVALKRPLPKVDEAARQLATEIKVLSLVQHAHLVRLLDHGRDEQGPFAVMPWIDGHVMSCGTISEERVRVILTELLSALHALHGAGFVHGDLNASNVLLSHHGQTTLIDLGNAASLSTPVCSTTGSIYSMAPELFDHQPLSIETDLYALGVLAYQALTGQLPFQGDTKPQVITAHHRHLRIPLRDCYPVTPELEAVIEGLISVQPDHRSAALHFLNPTC